MAKQTVYLETSVIGYLTSRPSRDLVAAAHQQITRDWFAHAADNYELFISQLVLREAASGDAGAAKERLAFLDGIPLLAVSEAAGELAARLRDAGAVPKNVVEDALHIALAAVHGVDFLLTWNCKHIANATMRTAIERLCRAAGYEPALICTPEELASEHEE